MAKDDKFACIGLPHSTRLFKPGVLHRILRKCLSVSVFHTSPHLFYRCFDDRRLCADGTSIVLVAQRLEKNFFFCVLLQQTVPILPGLNITGLRNKVFLFAVQRIFFHRTDHFIIRCCEVCCKVNVVCNYTSVREIVLKYWHLILK